MTYAELCNEVNLAPRERVLEVLRRYDIANCRDLDTLDYSRFVDLPTPVVPRVAVKGDI